jgi:hypothetical protein
MQDMIVWCGRRRLLPMKSAGSWTIGIPSVRELRSRRPGALRPAMCFPKGRPRRLMLWAKIWLERIAAVGFLET